MSVYSSAGLAETSVSEYGQSQHSDAVLYGRGGRPVDRDCQAYGTTVFGGLTAVVPPFAGGCLCRRRPFSDQPSTPRSY